MKWNGNNGQQILQRWQSGVAGAGQTWSDGIGRVTGESPTVKALARKDVAIQNFGNALRSQQYADACNRVTLAMWQGQCRLSLNNYTNGAQKGQAKFNRFVNRFGPIWTQIQQTVAALPKGGFANAQNRWAAAVRILMSNGRKGGPVGAGLIGPAAGGIVG